jgi:hypothetical protein
MKRATFSNLCVDQKAQAALRLLDGGWLLIYDGQKPDTADTLVTDQTLLAKLQFGSPAFQYSRNGIAEAYAFAPCLGEVFGTPKWFRTVTPRAVPMFDGTIGPDPEKYDMAITGDIFEGGEVIIDMFRYVEAKE